MNFLTGLLSHYLYEVLHFNMINSVVGRMGYAHYLSRQLCRTTSIFFADIGRSSVNKIVLYDLREQDCSVLRHFVQHYVQVYG